MTLIVSNELIVSRPSKALMDWCNSHLILSNPDFARKQRMGLYLGNTPRYLYLYRLKDDCLYLPYGVFRQIYPLLEGATIVSQLQPKTKAGLKLDIPLFDYQEPAVAAMVKAGFGILESKAGSGKTQMGLAIAGRLDCKTLWLTHTQDLLKQSYDRAAGYMDKAKLGTITAGKVHIGTGITFATVQTLSRQDMSRYRHEWDCAIVDECHRVSGTPTQVTQFSKVIGSLACKHKYGLSATLHRADGLMACAYALLGGVGYSVPDEAVADRVMAVTVRPVETGAVLTEDCLDTDGTLIYTHLIGALCADGQRNKRIAQALTENIGHHCLVLSERVEHLRNLMGLLPEEQQKRAVMINGSMTGKRGKAAREAAMEAMRSGEKGYLFATYGLAKEGLDIPCLDRLFLATPQGDYTVVTQAIGRIARVHEGKQSPICYDFVDSNIGYLQNTFAKRKRHYKKAGAILEG